MSCILFSCIFFSSSCIFSTLSNTLATERKTRLFTCAPVIFSLFYFINYVVYDDNAIKMVDYKFDYNNLHILMHIVKCAYLFFFRSCNLYSTFRFVLFCFVLNFLLSPLKKFKWFKSKSQPANQPTNHFLLRILPIFDSTQLIIIFPLASSSSSSSLSSRQANVFFNFVPLLLCRQPYITAHSFPLSLYLPYLRFFRI